MPNSHVQYWHLTGSDGDVSNYADIDTEWFRRRMRERRTTMAKVAARLGRDESVVSKILSGKLRMHLWQVPAFAAELGVTETEVLRHAGVEAPAVISAPLVSWVAATQFADVVSVVGFADEYPRIAVQHPSSTLLALSVAGDSMDRIAPEGSIIVVDYTAKILQDRDLAVFSRAGETTFKRYRQDENGVWLEPESFNPRHANIVPMGEEEVLTVGRVVAIPRVTRPSA